MTRDQRIDPKPGDTLVFRDGTEPSLARIESVGEDGMVRWREAGERWAMNVEDWPDHCERRKVTVLDGTAPLAIFRWRPGGARGGEMPAADVGEILFLCDGLLLIGGWASEYRYVETSCTQWCWGHVEWYVPIKELMPKKENHDGH